MQATLSPRSKNVLDLVSRKPSAASKSDATGRDARAGFADRLADARTTRTKDDAETKPTASAQDAAGTSKVKPASDAKKVDRTESRDDAASKSEESRSTSKKKEATKPEDAKVTDDAGTEVTDETAVVKPAKAAKPEELSPDAIFLSGQVAAPAKPEEEKAQTADDAKSPDAAAIAAALATTAAVQSDAATETQNSEQAAVAAPVDASLVKGATVDADAKPKAKAGDAKALESKTASAEAVPAPAAHGAPHKQHAEDDAGKQQNNALKATDQPADADKATTKKTSESTFDALLAKLVPQEAEAPKPTAAPVAPPQPTLSPERQFAADNVDNVVKGVRSQIEAGGNGQMRIRLDPPELGALEVSIQMTDGRISASFTTNNDNATQLLSHNLSNLKSSLEATGINVDRIQVKQSSAENNAQQQPGSGEHRRDGTSAFDQPSQRGDQQRKDAVEKMWRKLAYGSDELDFVA